MSASSSIDPSEFLHEHLEQASPDLLRQPMEGFLSPGIGAALDKSLALLCLPSSHDGHGSNHVDKSNGGFEANSSQRRHVR
jgi:hypothetical protein